MVSFVLASMSDGIVRFYVLTESQDFVRLAVAIAPVLIFGCLLSVRPAIAGIGLIMNNIFLVLLALGSAVLAGGAFKAFPETISPDGAYELAWGNKVDLGTDLATLTEVPYAIAWRMVVKCYE